MSRKTKGWLSLVAIISAGVTALLGLGQLWSCGARAIKAYAPVSVQAAEQMAAHEEDRRLALAGELKEKTDKIESDLAACETKEHAAEREADLARQLAEVKADVKAILHILIEQRGRPQRVCPP